MSSETHRAEETADITSANRTALEQGLQYAHRLAFGAYFGVLLPAYVLHISPYLSQTVIDSSRLVGSKDHNALHCLLAG